MMDSDSDDEVRLLFEEPRHTSPRGNDSGEPPRRRMRMDPGVTEHPTGMTLRSRAISGPGQEICFGATVPTASTSHSYPQFSNEIDSFDEDEDVIAENDSLFDEMSLPGISIPGSMSIISSPSPPVFDYSPTSSVISGYSIGPAGSNTIDLDLDLDYQTVDSFESYDPDQLLDVPVNRSPAIESPTASEDSADGESLFGLPNDVDNVGNIASEAGNNEGDSDANPAVWQRRRLQRRNAIVLENTDSLGSEGFHEREQEQLERTAKASVDKKLSSATTCMSAASDDTTVIKTVDEDENEVSNCIICCEPYANSGDHRLCCLKCGHTYGKFCIEKWIKNEARCPQCNAKASKKDIRVLYVRNLKALDTAERDRLRADLEVEREMKRKLELRNAQLDQRVNEIDNKYKSLSEEFRFLKERVGAVYRDPAFDYCSQGSNSTSNNTAPRSNKPLLSALTSFPCKDGECRVGAYDEWLNMLAVSQAVKSPLYPLGSYGVRKMNLLDMRETITTPLHLKEIRDLEFNAQGDILLSVGLDKRAILTNCNTNITVQAFIAESPLWSCAWSKTGPQHTFYAGTANSQILVYDIRNGREPVNTLVMPAADKTPTAGLKFITPSFGPNSFSMTGLLVQKLTSVWFCEFRSEEVRFHQLPIEGSFLSVDFEPKSAHALISTKASNKGLPSRHIVCNLTQYNSPVQQSTMVSCNIVQSYDGNEALQSGKLSRSCIFNPNKENVLVAAEVGGGTKHMASIWNVSETQSQQTLPGREQVLDFVHCRVNNEFLLASISANNLNMYKLKL